jgi:hypothetical protein
MKRIDFEKHLRKYRCKLLREGGDHSVWINLFNDEIGAVPRHKELDNTLCKKICKELGIPKPDKY